MPDDDTTPADGPAEPESEPTGAAPDDVGAETPDADGGEAPDAGGPLEPSPGSEPEARPRIPEPVRDRVLIPLLLPLAAMAAIAVYVLNISRVFLAASDNAVAVTTASLVTVAILAGAAAISAMPRLRSSTLTMTVSVLLVVVVSAGLVTLGPSEPEGEGASDCYEQPEDAPAQPALAVNAGPGTKFQAEEFNVQAGILEIDYVDKGQSHTLVFEGNDFKCFKLEVPKGPDKGTVELAEGDYTIFCTISGHRAQGMEATIHVAPAAPGAAPAPGAQPTTTTT